MSGWSLAIESAGTMSTKRLATMIFLVAATGLLLAGALLLPWWVGALEQGSFSVDLRGMQVCFEEGCSATKPLSMADSGAEFWAKLGTSVFATSLVAAFLLLGCVWLSFRRRPKSTYQWVAGALALFTGVLALLFVWLRPDFGDWSPSYGLACTLAGSILGAIAASASARLTVTEVSSP